MSARPSPLFCIVNQDNRHFNVRLVRKHEHYGDADALVHQQNEPLVEFFDASHTDEDSDNPLGYFTGIRCFVSTLFQTAFELGGAADRLFNESLPMWNISSENIAALQDWLLAHLDKQEKHCLRQPGYTVRSRPEPDAQALPESLCALFQETADSACPGFREQLLGVIEQVNTIEQADPAWQNGQIAVRLQLMAAKKHLLRALALL